MAHSEVSEVSICNMALSRIGAKAISSLDDPQSKNEVACVTWYANARDEALEYHPWSFAVARASLNQQDNPLGDDYQYRYPLPNDYIRAIDLPDATTSVWVIEGGYLYTDDTSVLLRYVKRETNPTLYTPHFVKALAFRLAADLAMDITGDETLADRMMYQYDLHVEAAVEKDALQSANPQQQNTDWETAGR